MADFLQSDLIWLGDKLKAFEGKTILVTGATGLIGSILLKAIDFYNRDAVKCINAVGVARNMEKVASIFGEESSIRFMIQDICQPLVPFSCDYVIHTANSTSSKMFITQPVEVMDSIYLGTKHLLEFAKLANVQGMVYLSSMEVFGRVDAAERIKEKELGYIDIQNVRSCYSEGKRIAECLCKCYAEEFGVSVKAARLAQTFGAGVQPSENRVFAQFARSAIRGEDIVLHTNGGSVGNYVYTRDAINAILMLLQKGENGEAYTIVNEDTTITIRDMAQLVAKEFSGGRSKVVFDIPTEEKYGYAPETHMRLSSKRMNELGWKAEVGLIDMYRRMLPDLVENG